MAERVANGLANRRLRPLGHLTADCKYTARKHLRDRAFLGLPTTVFQTAAFAEFGREICGRLHRLWAHSPQTVENPRRVDGARCASLRFSQCVAAG
jgi:hypothetical protein